MTAVASRLSIRAFIEGVEVPVIAVQVNSAPNSAMAASLQVPPLSEGLKILPRSLVHVFFDDFAGPHINSEFINQQANRPENATTQMIQDEGTMAGYRLLYVGEVVGVQWSKRATTRSLVLHLLDLSSYWDTAYQWMNTDIFGPGYKAVFSGGGTDMFTDFLASASEIVTGQLNYGIRKGSVQYPALRGLLGGIVRLLEKIGGSYMQGNNYPGSNAFFSLAELRLHVTQMISAYDKDPTAGRLLGGSWDGLFGRTIGNLGDHTNMRQVINALAPAIFHETYAQPCPLYTPGSGGTVSGYKRTTVMASAQTQVFALKGRELAIGIEELINRLDVPGTSRASILSTIRGLTNQCRVASNTVRDRNARQVRQHFSQATTKLGQAAGAASRWKPGTRADTQLRSHLSAAASKLRAIKSLTISETAKKDAIPARLHQQIMRPDIWFGPPPRCNVIFPEHYTQLDYQRMFLQEPTRLLLKTHEEFYGEDELFDKFYFAPYAKGLKGKNKNLLVNMLRRDILEHELYTGILPVYEKMGEFSIFAAQTGAVNGKRAKVGAAQRTSNFLYFKYRFEPRQLSVTMRFNPYLACGFPCLVIDKYMDQDLIQRHKAIIEANGGTFPQDQAKYFGTHFLGNAMNVTHSLQQDRGGVTLVQMNYARQADEKTEFLGMHQGDDRVKSYKRYENDALRKTDVASTVAPRIGSLGPAFGQITQVVDVTGEFGPQTAGDTSFFPSLPMYLSRRKGEAALPQVQVGVALPARAFGPDVEKLFDFPDQIVKFRAYRVTEEIPRYRREITNLPPEELIRPGWYGDIWHPGNIGKAYQFFLATGSICDQQQILDANGQEPAHNTATDGEATVVDPLDAEASTGNEQEFVDTAPAVLSLMRKYGLDRQGNKVNWVQVLDGVEFLMHVYSYVKQNPEISVDDFIRSYTWRPIATMLEMFGTPDLAYKYDPDARAQVVDEGIEGFHSRAFMPRGMSFENLNGNQSGDFAGDIFTLVPTNVEKMIGVSRDDKSSLFSMRGDVRKQKQDAVLEYLSSLLYARAILG